MLCISESCAARTGSAAALRPAAAPLFARRHHPWVVCYRPMVGGCAAASGSRVVMRIPKAMMPRARARGTHGGKHARPPAARPVTHPPLPLSQWPLAAAAARHVYVRCAAGRHSPLLHRPCRPPPPPCSPRVGLLGIAWHAGVGVGLRRWVGGRQGRRSASCLAVWVICYGASSPMRWAEGETLVRC